MARLPNPEVDCLKEGKSRFPGTSILVCVLVLLPLGYLFWLIGRDFSGSPRERAARSPMIVYATLETNGQASRFVVAEFWKNDKPGTVTIGSGIDLDWPKDAGPLPEGAIVFFEPTHTPNGPQLRPFSQWYVRSGRVGSVTIREFRKQCGVE